MFSPFANAFGYIYVFIHIENRDHGIKDLQNVYYFNINYSTYIFT